MADFEGLLNVQKPGQSIKILEAFEQENQRQEAKQPTQEEVIAIELMDWARSRLTREVFVQKVLDTLLDNANKLSYINVANHSLCSFHMGYKKAIEDLKENITNWQTGQAYKEAPEGET